MDYNLRIVPKAGIVPEAGMVALKSCLEANLR